MKVSPGDRSSAYSLPEDIAQLKQQLDDARTKIGWLEANSRTTTASREIPPENRRPQHDCMESQSDIRNIVEVDDGKRTSAVELEDQLRLVVTRILLGDTWSNMKAATYSQVKLEELIEDLAQWERTIRRSRRAKAKDSRRTLRRRRELLNVERDRFNELSHACDQLRQKLGLLREVTCGHAENSIAALTGCNGVLCMACYLEAKRGKMFRCFQFSCVLCRSTCPLLVVCTQVDQKERSDS